MAEDFYTQLKQRAQEETRANGACKQGYHDLLKAEDIGQFAGVLRKYRSEMLSKFKDSTLAILEEFYPANKETFNRIGIYYNEDSETGTVIVSGPAALTVKVSGDAKCYACGYATILVSDNAHVVSNDCTCIKAYGRSKVQLYGKSEGFAYEFSEIKANQYNLVHVYGNAHVIASGHAKVVAQKRGNIKLYGKAKYVSL